MPFFKALIPAFIAALFAMGCARTAKHVAFKFVQPAAAPAVTPDAATTEVKHGETVFLDAKPIQPLATPIYPNGSRKPDADPVTIVMRIVVGSDGRVEDMRKSIADLSVPTPFYQECFEAVANAVAQWRFEPAELAVVHLQPNGRPIIVSSTPTERRFEIAVTFSSSGRVAPEVSIRK